MPPYDSNEDGYIQARIKALTLNGSIRELRREAAEIRRSVAEALLAPAGAASAKTRVSYGWADQQLARAAAFDAEADLLDDNRPAGAAGLAS